MPQRQTQHITHRFSGGWAPDFGKLISAAPAQGGDMLIPYAAEAKNIFWNLDGGFRKAGGTAKLSAELESGAEIMGVYDYWKIGATGSYTRRKICHVGQFIYEDQDSDTWQKLGVATYTTLEDAKHPNYSTFNDLLIISSDGNTDVPMSWDQTTFQVLAGSPPNFAYSVEHRNRQWAAGVVSNPSRLYYCAADDPEDWVGSGSGFIDISPGDGDEIRGIASYKNELWVFKGPNKGSIHRITGSTPVDFARITFIRGLACAGHSTIVQVRDDLLFMTPTGSIRSLKATAAFGDYIDSALTFPIDSWLRTNLNKSKTKEAWAVNDTTESLLYLSIPTGSSAVNDTVLVYDYKFASVQQPDRWSRIEDWNAHSLALVNVSGLPTMFAGGTDGFVRKVNVTAKNIDSLTPVMSQVTSPFINYGSVTRFKTATMVGMAVSPKAAGASVEFEWTRDSTYANSVELSQGAATGVPLGVFVLGTDLLDAPNLNMNQVFADLEEGGDFRWVQYSIKQEDIDEDLVLHAVTVGIQFDGAGTE